MATPKAAGGYGNLIVSALHPRDREKLFGRAREKRLRPQELLYAADERLRYVYFPIEGIVATYGMSRDGATVQYSLVGTEGLVGLGAVLGDDRSVGNAIVQCAGLALQAPAGAVRDAMRESEALRRAVMRYASFRVTQVSQLSICAAHHPVQQRLARFLLGLVERSDETTFRATHESLGAVLGARREAISLAMRALQRLGGIDAGRGRIAIRDRARLESQCCECYPLLKSELLLLKREIADSSSNGSQASHTDSS